jgi:hypothetical protein
MTLCLNVQALFQLCMHAMQPPLRDAPLRLPRPLQATLPLQPFSPRAASATALLRSSARATTPPAASRDVPAIVIATSQLVWPPVTCPPTPTRGAQPLPTPCAGSTVGHSEATGATLCALTESRALSTTGAMAIVTSSRLVVVQHPPQALQTPPPNAQLARSSTSSLVRTAATPSTTEAHRGLTSNESVPSPVSQGRLLDAPHSLLAHVSRAGPTTVEVLYWQPAYSATDSLLADSPLLVPLHPEAPPCANGVASAAVLAHAALAARDDLDDASFAASTFALEVLPVANAPLGGPSGAALVPPKPHAHATASAAAGEPEGRELIPMQPDKEGALDMPTVAAVDVAAPQEAPLPLSGGEEVSKRCKPAAVATPSALRVPLMRRMWLECVGDSEADILVATLEGRRALEEVARGCRMCTSDVWAGSG